MTLDEAAEILNERKHKGETEWEVLRVYEANPRPHPDDYVGCGGDPHNVLTPFEAIAIAEKYERTAYQPGRVGQPRKREKQP